MKSKRWIKITTCLFVVAAVCATSIFSYFRFFAKGKAVAPYVEGSVENVKDTVTLQSDSAIPLTSTNDKLPKIPTTKGTKGSKDNPFVLLEIVPDHSEEAMSYLVSSPEEGLPYDPVELGRKLCKEYNTSLMAYKDNPVNFNNFLSDKIGGVFNNNNHYLIYEGKGNATEISVDYTTIDKLYSIKTTDISEGDMEAGKSIKALATAYPSVFEKDKNGKTITDSAILDENNWECVKGSEPYRDYEVKILDGIQAKDYDKLTMEQLAEKYKTEGFFKKSTDGTSIDKESLKDEKGWKREKTTTGMNFEEISETKSTGYLLNVGKGNGDFKMRRIWENPYYMVKSDNKEENQWKYVEELPKDSYDILAAKQKHEIADNINDGSLENGYFILSEENKAKLVTREGGWRNDIPQYRFTYKRYPYEFHYYALKLNDILKRRLFYRSTKEEYDKFHIQVISLTPAEINEMDQNDTPETLSYIERADMFYVAMFNAGDDNIKHHINFYKKYIKNQTGVNKEDDVTFHDYYDNDLEWNDCMKIMKRLATNINLPMMYENVVGDMVDKGVNEDGTPSCHIYLNEENPDLHQVGSLNNIAKLYLTTVQLDLTRVAKPVEEDTKSEGEEETNISFLKDIYPKFKQIKLTKRAETHENSAKYTGYYERNNGTLLCSCKPKEGATPEEIAQLTDYKKRCFYLWGKAMFLPEEVIKGDNNSDFKKLVDNYGFLNNYIDGGNPSGFNNNNYNGGMNRANSTRGDDEKNVTVVYDNSANTNKTILDNGGFNNMGSIAEEILANGGQFAEDMVAYAVNNKSQYLRLDKSNIMVDYSKDAKYQEDKMITLKCNVENHNNEAGALTSVTFFNSKENKAEKLEVTDMKKEKVFQDVVGYRMPKEATTTIRIPFSRELWQKGYDVIRLQTKGIRSYMRKGKLKYSQVNTKEYDISISNRTLFNLE